MDRPALNRLGQFIELNNRVIDRFSAAERQNIGIHACPGGDCDSVHSADVPYAELLPTADVLKMRLSDISGGALEVRPNKTQKTSGKKLRILLDDPNGGRTHLGQLVDKIKGRDRKVASLFLIATPAGTALNKGTLRIRFDDARAAAAAAAEAANNPALAARIRAFQFRDIRPKAASETDLTHASKLLGHTDKQITRTVYQRVSETVMPMK